MALNKKAVINALVEGTNKHQAHPAREYIARAIMLNKTAKLIVDESGCIRIEVEHNQVAPVYFPKGQTFAIWATDDEYDIEQAEFNIRLQPLLDKMI
jgi:hypothetical protein